MAGRARGWEIVERVQAGELLVFDGFACEKYPQFDDIYALLQQKHPDGGLSREIVRKELRYAIVSYLHHNLGEEIHIDTQESYLLQRGLLTLGEGMPGGLPDLPLYNALRERHEEEKKKLAAAEAKDAQKKPEAE